MKKHHNQIRQVAMSLTPNATEVIASALSLPFDERLSVVGALHASLADPQIDHGPEEPATAVAAAWKDEIARRLQEIESGDMKTVPADQAEAMIRSDARPNL